MYYVATPQFIARWNQAKQGELICRMERAIGGTQIAIACVAVLEDRPWGSTPQPP